MTASAPSRPAAGAPQARLRRGAGAAQAHFRRGAGAALLACVLIAGLSACEPVRRSHGYAPRPDQVSRVVVGSDTQAQVVEKLGRPPIVGAFDENVWVYVFRQTERTVFWNECVLQQQAVVVEFDAAGTVRGVNHYGLEDGVVVDLVTRTTPTRGKRLNFLQQLFGNIGRFEAGGSNTGVLRTPGRSGF